MSFLHRGISVVHHRCGDDVSVIGVLGDELRHSNGVHHLRGRPKGAKNLPAMFLKAATQPVKVNMAGRTVRMSKVEASLHQLNNKASSGDLRAIREVLYWFRLLAEQEQATAQPQVLDEDEKRLMNSVLRRLQRLASASPGSEGNRESEPEGGETR